MELLMWVGIYALLIVINGTVSSKLDNEHEAINLENVFATSNEKKKYLQIIRFFKVSELFACACARSFHVVGWCFDIMVFGF